MEHGLAIEIIPLNGISMYSMTLMICTRSSTRASKLQMINYARN